MNNSTTLENITCPYCDEVNYDIWAQELGFNAVRCAKCLLIYVNPRPLLSMIDDAVKTGSHGAEAQYLNVKSRRISSKIALYRKIIGRIFLDVWRSGRKVNWLDVGAGYGEIVEAVTQLAPKGSRIQGIEPMHAKASHAKARGLDVKEGYLDASHPKVDFISIINIFSHIPNFHDFLTELKGILSPEGEILIETGNLADLAEREDFPDELGLPDHLVFAGHEHINGYLEKAGFQVVKVEKVRVDTISRFIINIIKKLIDRPVILALPYTSKYRQLFIRARLK